MRPIGLIDYGMGNLHSVNRAFKRLDEPLKLVKTSNDIKNCSALILPGVGAFDPAMDHLRGTKLVPFLKEWALEDKPLLGICLGLHLLFDTSEEGESRGLGIIKGEVKRLPQTTKEKIPHMGWAPLIKENLCPLIKLQSKQNWVYFVHSYCGVPINSKEISATVNFGDKKIAAIVWKGRVGACQFHPEKSSKSGEMMLKNWINWLKDGAISIK
tara:strand:+ start:962 stop:1600 length:639 start_codon:yes stop_codon:yes gene_type:complete